MLKKHRPKTSKNRPKNVPKMVPGASPGPPRGLPEASLGPPGGHFRGHATQREKTRKTKRLSGPHFSEKREIYRPRLDPEIVPKRPRERNISGKRCFFWCPGGGDSFGRVFPSIFRWFFMFFFRCVCSRIFRQFRKMEKCLKHCK